ncbi:uncharacterized zinc finger protein CG2678 [Drosophila grimshawi]|uniref:GH20590 n=1 Tax=Drosophila grimshawi TaxID=7222 RepID=B4J7X4_DROGR|nr:uncharacterized zinc finger protein CG2678 [Drosophila grimshawi]EDW01180.1 GH20590 [Drosophila grimshawi]
MEEEITAAATTNGVATNGKETAIELEAAQTTSSPNVWDANNAVEQEEEEAASAPTAAAADAADIDVYIEEGNTDAHVEPQAVAGEVVAAVEAAVEEVEEEMGEAEYLEDETPENEFDDERELNEVENEKTAKTAAAVDKNNAQNEQTNEEEAKDEEAAAGVASTVTAEKELSVEEEAHTDEKDAAEEGEADGDEGEADGEEEEDLEDEEEEEEEDEGELITGDDAQAELGTAGDQSEEANARARSGARNQEEQVDENQCRVCTTKEQLVSLFTKTGETNSTPADMLVLICPSVSIAPKDFMPQFICNSCLVSLTVAIKLRKQLETTEQDLRKRLSRSKNKVRRPRGYVVIDAPVSDSASDEDEEELNDDVEFKVSDVAGSTSADSDSADSDISEKRKPGRRRGRKKGMKRASGSNNSYDEDHPRKKNRVTSPSSATAASQGPFECDQCNLSFQRKQSYVMHRKMHDSRQEFHCQICNKKFKVRGAYKTHMERHAAERAQFRCELCAQVFRLRAELKRHMALSHDEHGIIYECKRCQRTFLTQTRLQRHQSTNCNRHSEQKVKRQSIEGHPSQGRDLFKSVAPLTTTYWSDSFSD